jgi:hypothetical protein
MTDVIAGHLSPADVRVEPGAAPPEIVVEVRNQSAIVEAFEVRLDGLDPAWYTVQPDRITLLSGCRSQPGRWRTLSGMMCGDARVPAACPRPDP